MNSSPKNHFPKNSRYDDWLCLLCQNHNYSFRLICTQNTMQATDAISKPRNKMHIWINSTNNIWNLHTIRNISPLSWPSIPSRMYSCSWSMMIHGRMNNEETPRRRWMWNGSIISFNSEMIWVFFRVFLFFLCKHIIK